MHRIFKHTDTLTGALNVDIYNDMVKDVQGGYTTTTAVTASSRRLATQPWADEGSTTTRNVSIGPWPNKLNGQIPSQRSASQRLLFNLHQRPHLTHPVRALVTTNNGSWTTLRISVIYALQETMSLQSEGG